MLKTNYDRVCKWRTFCVLLHKFFKIKFIHNKNMQNVVIQ